MLSYMCTISANKHTVCYASDMHNNKQLLKSEKWSLNQSVIKDAYVSVLLCNQQREIKKAVSGEFNNRAEHTVCAKVRRVIQRSLVLHRTRGL